MVVGINNNSAAISAQSNLGSANSVVSKSVSRLSSGNRIINASDDAAGLAVGTRLASSVTALKIGLLNANQAGTVLQIADGALKQVGDILSRQKALSVQANSGSLSDTERGFLNQEFTKLTSEIDRIVSNTNFNGITLLNGSISGDAGVKVSGPASVTTPETTTPETVVPGAVAASTTGAAFATLGTSAISGVAATGFATAGSVTVDLTNFGDFGAQSGFGTFTVFDFDDNSPATSRPNEARFQTTINGKIYISEKVAATDTAGNIAAQAITFTAQDGSGDSFDVTTTVPATTALASSGSATTYATNLTAALAPISIYQDRDVTPAAAAAGALAGISTTAATIRSNNFNTTLDTYGTAGKFTVVAGSGAANSISVIINGTTYSDSDVNNAQGTANLLQAGESITLIGRNAGGDVTGETLTIDLTGLSTSIDLTDADDAQGLEDALNAYFGVTVTPETTTPASTTGGYSTVGTIAGTKVTSVSVSSFSDANYQGGFGTISVAPGTFDENGSGAESVTLTTTLGDKTYTAGIVASGNGGNIASGNLVFTATDGSGSSFSLAIASETGGINTATAAGTYAAALTTALANVDIYQTRTVTNVDATAVEGTVLKGLSATSVTLKSNQFDTTKNTFGNISAFTSTVGADNLNSLSVKINGVTFSAKDLGGADNILSAADGTITLNGQDAAGNATGQQLIIDISDLTRTIDLTNTDEVASLTSALNGLVNVTNAGGLSFQVGSSVADKIDVSIASIQTSALYVDNAGVAKTLDISTAAGAIEAASVLDNAINSVVGRRADVGALQSRFNFASSNLEIAIANQDAARGSFLDADISAESTDFANAQVRLQASVSVLAQANQLPQNLLRLLQ